LVIDKTQTQKTNHTPWWTEHRGTYAPSQEGGIVRASTMALLPHPRTRSTAQDQQRRRRRRRKMEMKQKAETEVETETDADGNDCTSLSDIIQAGSKSKARKFRKPGLYLAYKRILVEAYGELKVSVSWHDKIYDADASKWEVDGKGDAENTFVCTSAL
jgi:hypothetical protein